MYEIHLFVSLIFTSIVMIKYLFFNNKKQIVKTKQMIIKEKLVEESYKGFNVDNEYKHLSEIELQELNNKLKENYSVMAFNIYGGLNMGTMIRNSVISAADTFYYAGYREFDRRTMVGAQNYINIKRIKDIIYQNDVNSLPEYNVDNFIKFINDNNFTPIFIEQGGISLNDINFRDIKNNIENNNKKMLLIFGSESYGIPICILNTCALFKDSMIISIEQFGILHSHNVAVACGIILYNLSISLNKSIK